MSTPLLATLVTLFAFAPALAAAEEPQASPSPSEPGAEVAQTENAQAESDAAPIPDDTGAMPERPASLAFADHLFVDGDWYRAITEYRRFLFEVRGRHDEAPRAALAIGEALLRGEQWDAAGRQLDGVAQRTSDPTQRWTALFGAGRAYLEDKRPELAKPRFRVIAEDEGAPGPMRHEARWLLAWGHFDAGEFDVARSLFVQIAADGAAHAEAAQGMVETITARDTLDRKNPLLAGALSLVPGLGHLYLGRVGVGLTSFLWNGLFLFATVSAWLSGNWGVALVLTLFELGWYGGGIFGAVSGAVRHNRDAVRNWRDDALARFGEGRALPEMHLFDHRDDARPGAAVRFGLPALAI
ncbi:MAG: tetratricopeptide repeat protein [Myxococcota bacterium]